MQVLTLLSQKGGTGKTTIALHLAVAAERDGKPSAVIDLDPQQSAALWGDTRESETPAVVSAQPARLPQVLETAKEHDAAFAVIDTAPHSESAALAAARAADFCLIPCRAAILDLKAIGTSIDVARLAKKPFAVLLNAVPPRGSLPVEAAEAVRGYGVDLVPVCLVHRAAYVYALTAGQTAQEYEPKGKAAEEITKLYTWLRTYVYK
jgi:chromosome partitioning protein